MVSGNIPHSHRIGGGHPDLGWSVPVMRAGFVGRGLVYLAVAGFSLYAIWYGGQARGTSSVLRQLEGSSWGSAILFLIFIGMFAFAIWRVVNAYYDLENRGSDSRGIITRLGRAIGGLVGLGIGGLAFSLLFVEGGKNGGVTGAGAQAGGSGGHGSSIETGVAMVMSWPGGRWIVGIGGLIVIAAGIAFFLRGWKERYREFIRANHFTERWNWALKAGVMARGVIIATMGVLLILAAWRIDPHEAGGIGKAFSWLTFEVYGQSLVVAVCLGLLGYALFCFVNAAYRIVPKVAGGDIETLASRLKARMPAAT